MMQQDTYRQAVYELQLFLRGIMADEVPDLKADSIYGPQTRKAVSLFQQRHDLPVTGEADLETWEKIRQAYYQAFYLAAPPMPPIFFHDFCAAHREAKAGEAGDNVYVLQAMLRRIGQRYLQFSGVKMTGKLDPETMQALYAVETVFSSQADTPCTTPETVGSLTIQRLSLLYNSVEQGNLHKVWKD